MRSRTSFLSVGIGALILSAGTGVAAADTHIILATDAFQWSYNGKHAQVTIINDLKVGDILDIQVPATLKHKQHGFATTDLGPPITEIEDPVLKCGETGAKEKTAALREVCAPGAVSQFHQEFIGSMKLIVTDQFKKDVPFWCVVHQQGMQGVLQLQAAKPK
jgi:hypothetical protein